MTTYQVETRKMTGCYNDVVDINFSGFYSRLESDLFGYYEFQLADGDTDAGYNYEVYAALPAKTEVVCSFEFPDVPRFELVDLRPQMEARERDYQNGLRFANPTRDVMDSGNVTTREGTCMLETPVKDQKSNTRIAYLLESVPAHLQDALVEDLIPIVENGQIQDCGAYSVDCWPDAAGQAIVAYTPLHDDQVASWIEHHRYSAVVTFKAYT